MLGSSGQANGSLRCAYSSRWFDHTLAGLRKCSTAVLSTVVLHQSPISVLIVHATLERYSFQPYFEASSLTLERSSKVTGSSEINTASYGMSSASFVTFRALPWEYSLTSLAVLFQKKRTQPSTIEISRADTKSNVGSCNGKRRWLECS